NYTNIPMRYCYPSRNNHKFNLSDVFGGEYPTDSYYADLSYSDSDSWDSDGDGFYGEFRDDEADFLTEVSVGRIPTNNPDQVVYALEKSTAFEMDTGDWKRNVLHAGAILMFKPFDDGAKGVDHIEKELMNDMSISHYSEKEGVKTSDFPWDPLTEETFTNDWKTGKYGIVNWFGHGWSNKVARWVWVEDKDDDNSADSDELEWKDFINVNSELDDDYPSIIYCKSCVVGYPETCPDDWPEESRGNLGVDLLIKPSFGTGVAVMSSTRVCYLIGQWVTNNIGFEFNKELIINHLPVGDAFFKAKFNYCQNCENDIRDYYNKFGYNLYGDPSLVYVGINVEGKPDKPIISGSTQGKIGEEYNYSALSSDPDNDNIYYLFNWGDSSNSGWLGPYMSGDECNTSHNWSNKGEYEIKVRVKDVNGLISDWSNPLIVKMPRNKLYINSLIKNFLENHTIIYNLIQRFLKLYSFSFLF
ncbi:MAG: PKD domain-containing protein, partial [Thermoplasmatales archaeon]